MNQPIVSDNIQTIIFDFGGVLLDIDINRAIQSFEQLGIAGIGAGQIHPHNTGIFLESELGTISTNQFLDGLRAAAPPEVQAELTDSVLLKAWNSLLLDYDLRRFELLERLAKRYRILLLSNTNAPHRECFIERFNALSAGKRFEQYFDRTFYSDLMHLRKPDPQIYNQVIETCGLRAEDTLFIDDNLMNVEGARSVGLVAYHLQAPTTILDIFAQ